MSVSWSLAVVRLSIVGSASSDRSAGLALIAIDAVVAKMLVIIQRGGAKSIDPRAPRGKVRGSYGRHRASRQVVGQEAVNCRFHKDIP